MTHPRTTPVTRTLHGLQTAKQRRSGSKSCQIIVSRARSYSKRAFAVSLASMLHISFNRSATPCAARSTFNKTHSALIMKPQQYPRAVACSFAKHGISSLDLLHSIQSEPAFAKHMEDQPGFKHMVGMHMLLHDLINQQAPLELATTRVSDEQGVFLRHTTAEPFKSATVRVQTMTGPAPIDWAHHTLAVAPHFGYSKSSIFAADDSLLPHLEMEMTGAGLGDKLLLMVNMDPRLSLTCHPQYLDHFYTTAPPGASQSWLQLEAQAAKHPAFTRFTSPSLHVRACSASAILFHVSADDDGLAATKQVVADAVAIWIAWLKAAADADKLAAALGDAPNQDHQQLIHELATRSKAWRSFPRREAAAGALKAAFGAETMEDYWDSMAGAGRVRLDGCSISVTQ